jgi:hypothetical protein
VQSLIDPQMLIEIEADAVCWCSDGKIPERNPLASS